MQSQENLCWVCKKPPALFQNPTTLNFFILKFLHLIGPLCSFFLCSVWVNKQQQQANGKGVGGSWLLYALSPFTIQKGTKPAVWPLFFRKHHHGNRHCGATAAHFVLKRGKLFCRFLQKLEFYELSWTFALNNWPSWPFKFTLKSRRQYCGHKVIIQNFWQHFI